jgi:hypothetical protein
MQEHHWAAIALGVVVAGVVHAGKAAARPAIHIGTLGIGGPVVSAVEDAVSLTMSVIAIFVPVLVIAAIALLAWAFMRLVRRTRKPRGPSAFGAAPS